MDLHNADDVPRADQLLIHAILAELRLAAAEVDQAWRERARPDSLDHSRWLAIERAHDHLRQVERKLALLPRR